MNVKDIEKETVTVEQTSSTGSVHQTVSESRKDHAHLSQEAGEGPEDEGFDTEHEIRHFKIFHKISQKLDSFGIEQRGINRIKPHERSKASRTSLMISIITFWISASGGLSTMSTFILAANVFNLEFKQSVVCGMVAQIIGCAVAAYCSTMGPKSGCRQMVTARYLFGWWFVKFVGFIGCVGVLGWSVVNCVVGGEILSSVSDGKIPLFVGIIIVAVISFTVSIFGIKQLLRIEKYISIPVMVMFMLMFISLAPEYKTLNDFSNKDIDSITLKGYWLSFFSLGYSVTATWGTIAADYYILFPENTPSYETFLLTFFGIMVPSTFVAILGLILSNLSMTNEAFIEGYADYGMGGLLNAGFSRFHGFGKFCAIVLLLSLIANNIINTYSAAFSIQLLGIWFARIPRWLWVIGISATYLAATLVGRDHFSVILGNFLPMIGYWISMYFIMLLEENLIFRDHFLHLFTKEFPEGQTKEKFTPLSLRSKRQNYNWNKWNDFKVLTNGYAAFISFLAGVAGCVLGMSQVYYIGVIAKNIGDGDIGMWLSMGFTGVLYPGLRYLELKKFGR
ncbi:hypothetical protein WICPIJ_004002 [Wickerhamomyces pijperi]|uniref:Vitamin B6 transporter TPN1 n=1 Tax=Wickerhamomyces pijperi TaxID=599730 RepID=A0A9P8Q633_WICPI|nr:hypothetical protein WICPIJ_004002 [Wickerhamomyces pijperi]